MFKELQKIGKSFMLPIAILPAAGLLLGIGGALSNATTIMAYPILNNAILQNIFKVMSGAGDAIFANLSLLLCMGLSIGLAKKDKATAVLSSVVGFIIMNATINTLLKIVNAERGIDTGVVGSLVIGAVVVMLHNRYHNIQLPQFLGFFGGSRFVPIISAFAALFVGTFFFFVWPIFQGWLLTAGKSIAGMGLFGTFLYGFLLRLTGAVGLHHMIYPLFWLTELGGTAVINGTEVVGAQKIFFAQLADPNHVGLFTEGTRFFAGRFATMMFGLPGAALAMYHCVPKTSSKKKYYAGLFFGVALTSFVTGITEPLEYMFLFVSPLLYVVHAFFDGISFLIADLLQIRIGNTFSGGVIDFTLFGVLQGQEKTHFLYVFVVGAVWFALYYITFRFLIKALDVRTPGRYEDDEEEVEEVKSNSDENLKEDAIKIIGYLGGKENIEDVDACITRLRVAVKDSTKVDKDSIKKLGAAGVLEVKGGIQAIFGAKAVLYKNVINDILGLE